MMCVCARVCTPADQLRMRDRKDQKGARQQQQQRRWQQQQQQQQQQDGCAHDGKQVLAGDGSTAAAVAQPRPAPDLAAHSDSAGAAIVPVMPEAAHVAEAAAAAAAAATAAALDDLVAVMDVDRVAAQLGGLPKHVAARLLRWPPLQATVPSCATFKLSRASVLLAGRCVQLPVCLCVAREHMCARRCVLHVCCMCAVCVSMFLNAYMPGQVCRRGGATHLCRAHEGVESGFSLRGRARRLLLEALRVPLEVSSDPVRESEGRVAGPGHQGQLFTPSGSSSSRQAVPVSLTDASHRSTNHTPASLAEAAGRPCRAPRRSGPSTSQPGAALRAREQHRSGMRERGGVSS